MPQSRSYVEISRSQIAENYRKIRDAVGASVQVMGVVKADAYGHGAIEVSRVLCGNGAQWLAVSSVDEGTVLRKSGITVRILVMAGVLPHERASLLEHDLTPVAHSLEEVQALDDLARPLSFHLKIDTGMTRLGTRATVTEIASLMHTLRHARIEGIMSHFASAADFTSEQTEEQIRAFNATVTGLREAGISPPVLHLSSTNAVAYAHPDAWKLLVRPGHAIYGYVSPARGGAPKNLLHVKPVLTWKAKIIVVKDIPAGARVGYGGSFVASHAMRIAVLSAGYADGIPHRLSNRGRVIAAGKLTPILGTVSMDLTTIDVSHAPHLQPGDDVTLLGREGAASLDAQEIAKTAGTISYNVLCGISARVKRIYV